MCRGRGFRCLPGARGRIDDRRRHRSGWHDIPVPQYAAWRELELLVAYAGSSPAEAPHAVTAANASILGGCRCRVSVLEAANLVDLLVPNANPRDDLQQRWNTRHWSSRMVTRYEVSRPLLADIDAPLDGGIRPPRMRGHCPTCGEMGHGETRECTGNRCLEATRI